MTSDAILEKVRSILSAKLGVDPATIAGKTRLAEDLGVDSFGAVELIFEIEEAFGLEIADSEIEHVRSVGDIVAYVEAWMARPGAAPTR